MRLAIVQIILISSVLSAYATDALGQEVLKKRISIAVKNTDLKSVLEKVEMISDIKFAFSSNIINVSKKISFSVEDKAISEILNQYIKPLGIGYKVVGNLIILYEASNKEEINEEEINKISTIVSTDVGISGTVTGQAGQPLPGVTVAIKGTAKGTTTNSAGNYSIQVPGSESVLQFSFVGYITKEVVAGSQTVINVTLESSTQELTGVVVTALGIKRQAKSLGYSATSVNTADLTIPGAVNVGNNLVGKVAGVNVNNLSSGAGGTANRRGVRSRLPRGRAQSQAARSAAGLHRRLLRSSRPLPGLVQR